MRTKFFILLATLFISVAKYAQAPAEMGYQAVVKDASNTLVTDQAVGIQISILQTNATGTAVYVETQTPTTDSNGVLSIKIGGIAATVVSGGFSVIDWAAGPYFIKTETDPTGSTSYTITGTSEILSVPYAYYATTAGNATTADYATTADHATTVENISNSVSKCGCIGYIIPYMPYSGTANQIIYISNLPESWFPSNNEEEASADIYVDAFNETGSSYDLGLVGTISSGKVMKFKNLIADALAVKGFTSGNLSLRIRAYPSDYVFVTAGYHIGGAENISVPIECVREDDIVDVTSASGKVWMDRNLGAYRVASRYYDALSFGDLFQWGRAADGHEDRGSSTTNTQSSTDAPGDSNFIIGSSDWLSTPNDNLWQGASGTNNPCPTGYRLPTSAEWETELSAESITDYYYAYNSVLGLTLAEYRESSDGIISEFNVGNYASSTVSGENVNYLNITTTTASIETTDRARGLSVRCIKD